MFAAINSRQLLKSGLAAAIFFISACANLDSIQEIPQEHHPLDPLTASEYSEAITILQAAGYLTEASRFTELELLDPPKQSVRGWQAGDDVERTAFAIVKQGEQTFEARISLTDAAVLSWVEIEGVQPSLIVEDFINTFRILAEDEEFVAALASRGYSPDEVGCSPMTLGNYNIPRYQGRRLIKTPCYALGEGSRFTRPIEGIFAVVDVAADEVYEFIDYANIPVADNPASTDVELSRRQLNETGIYQPDGANFTVNGHLINWDNWRFHYRMEKRSGLVISDVYYQDGDNERAILYQGAVSELFVPYMDPDTMWYSRTFLDAGEYGFGASATPLASGADCPVTGLFLDANVPDDFGNAFTIPNAICIFERNVGDPAWRHFEFDSGFEGRPAVELVVRMGAAIGNYDYFIDWVFTQDGRIRPRIGASGYDGYKGVLSQSMNDDTAEADAAFGTLVAPGLIGVNHDHFFSFRLDLDIDGINNSLSLDRLVPRDIEGPRSAWVIESEIAATESLAKINYNPARPANWRIMNPNVTGPVGHAPGYLLKPLNSIAYTLLDEQDPAHQRAAFTQHQLWVTPYAEDERYAAGNYVNQGEYGMGLPEWTVADRAIENTDIVIWYSAGFHHAPRTEDFPIMPFAWHEFELMPYNFFQRNPALDVPASWRAD
jgi:primary-amine oxidase